MSDPLLDAVQGVAQNPATTTIAGGTGLTGLLFWGVRSFLSQSRADREALRAETHSLKEELTQFRVAVAERYLPREEFRQILQSIDTKLEHITERIDSLGR